MLHAVLLTLAALWTLEIATVERTFFIDSRFDESDTFDGTICPWPDLRVQLTDSGSSGVDAVFQPAGHVNDASIELPVNLDQLVGLNTAKAAAPHNNSSQDNGARKAGVSAKEQGRGSGVGIGDGPGFFGMEAKAGQKIIFVVDNSRSMNHPHDSPAKTRFKRLQMELVKSILEMQGNQSFYVIFFGAEVTPMPSTSLQPSLAGYREPYLKWVAGVTASGSTTDPVPALAYALQLRPDVICFLTDGDFERGVKRRLLSLKQTQTAIHTFAFGELIAEDTLRTLAENNAGQYRFVP